MLPALNTIIFGLNTRYKLLFSQQQLQVYLDLGKNKENFVTYENQILVAIHFCGVDGAVLNDGQQHLQLLSQEELGQFVPPFGFTESQNLDKTLPTSTKEKPSKSPM